LTDFSISLLRLHELTGKQIYAESSKRMLKGILNEHKEVSGNMFVLKVFKDGSVDRIIDVKYNFLLLKRFICEIESQEIYKEPFVLHDLLKDR